MVRMERLELSRLSALTPQASVSTNSTTSAYSIVDAPRRQLLAAGAGCCVPVAGAVAGVAGAGLGPVAGAGCVSGSIGNWLDGSVCNGAGASAGSVSITLVGAFCWLNRYDRPRLDRKNSVASTAVVRDRNEAEPRAPNTVPEAPAPKPAPASAPLPRCSSTRPTIAA